MKKAICWLLFLTLLTGGLLCVSCARNKPGETAKETETLAPAPEDATVLSVRYDPELGRYIASFSSVTDTWELAVDGENVFLERDGHLTYCSLETLTERLQSVSAYSGSRFAKVLPTLFTALTVGGDISDDLPGKYRLFSDHFSLILPDSVRDKLAAYLPGKALSGTFSETENSDGSVTHTADLAVLSAYVDRTAGSLGTLAETTPAGLLDALFGAGATEAVLATLSEEIDGEMTVTEAFFVLCRVLNRSGLIIRDDTLFPAIDSVLVLMGGDPSRVDSASEFSRISGKQVSEALDGYGFGTDPQAFLTVLREYFTGVTFGTMWDAALRDRIPDGSDSATDALLSFMGTVREFFGAATGGISYTVSEMGEFLEVSLHATAEGILGVPMVRLTVTMEPNLALPAFAVIPEFGMEADTDGNLRFTGLGKEDRVEIDLEADFLAPDGSVAEPPAGVRIPDANHYAVRVGDTVAVSRTLAKDLNALSGEDFPRFRWRYTVRIVFADGTVAYPKGGTAVSAVPSVLP